MNKNKYEIAKENLLKFSSDYELVETKADIIYKSKYHFIQSALIYNKVNDVTERFGFGNKDSEWEQSKLYPLWNSFIESWKEEHNGH